MFNETQSEDPDPLSNHNEKEVEAATSPYVSIIRIFGLFLQIRSSIAATGSVAPVRMNKIVKYPLYDLPHCR